MQFLANHSDQLFGLINNSHHTAGAANDLISQGLHLDKLGGFFKQIFDTNPTNAANSLVDKIDKLANPDMHGWRWLIPKGDKNMFEHAAKLKEIKHNLADIAKIGGVALPAFIGERLAALGIRNTVKKGVEKQVKQQALNVVSKAAAIPTPVPEMTLAQYFKSWLPKPGATSAASIGQVGNI
jgi:hypothetical protein